MTIYTLSYSDNSVLFDNLQKYVANTESTDPKRTQPEVKLEELVIDTTFTTLIVEMIINLLK